MNSTHDLVPALIRTEDALRLALSSARVLVWEWIADDPVIRWGQGAEQIYGRPASELSWAAWTRAVHPEDREPVLRLLDRAIAGSESWETEFRIHWQDGSERWILSRGQVLPASAERPTTLLGVNMDITPRKRAERENHFARERLEAALTASRTGTFRWDIRTNALTWDRGLDQLFGFPAGRTAQSLAQFLATVHPEDRAEVLARCQACVQGGPDFNMEFRVVWPDGSIHWLYDRGRTSYDAEGHPCYMTGACVDITRRKDAEDALRASERDLRILIDAMPALVAYIDRDLIVRRANRAYVDWFGVSAREVEGRPVHSVLSPDQYEKTAEYRQRALQGEAVSFESDILTVRGMRQIHANFIPHRDADGADLGFAVLTTDITERKQAEETLRKQEKLAVVGRLASSIAHEINNPLEAVTNLLYLAEHDSSPEARLSYVREAQQQLARVTHVTTHALRFQRQYRRLSYVDASALLDSVLAL